MRQIGKGARIIRTLSFLVLLYQFHPSAWTSSAGLFLIHWLTWKIAETGGDNVLAESEKRRGGFPAAAGGFESNSPLFSTVIHDEIESDAD